MASPARTGLADLTVPLPFFTSQISITRTRLSEVADPYDPPSDYPTPESQLVATNIRAVIAPPVANENLSIGGRIVYDARLNCEPCDIRDGDTVTELTGLGKGRVWTVLGPTPFEAFFLSGMQATLRLVESFAQ